MSRPPIDGLAMLPTCQLAAHLLTAAGSEISRSGELLELVGWEDEHLMRRLRHALELVQGVRLLVDGRLQESIFKARGVELPEGIRNQIELAEGLLSE